MRSYFISLSAILLYSLTPAISQATIKDYDGNVYKTVKIGTQVWMAENLKTTHYRNGDAIAHVKDNIPWGKQKTGACCVYNNDTNNVPAYGRLYNWYAATDTRNICPVGWHIPSDAEWTKLTDFLGGLPEAGGKMKEKDTLHWSGANAGATNSCGFLGTGGGNRELYGGYYYMKMNGFWWSSDIYDDTDARLRSLSFKNTVASRSNASKAAGLSIRCVKD